MSTFNRPRGLHVLVSLACAIWFAGCGGGDDESLVTVWTALPTAPNSYYPAEGASPIEEAFLNSLGVRTSNRRCSRDTEQRNGEMVLFVEGITPNYVLFDIPASNLSKALATHYYRYVPGDDGILSKPYYACESRGF